MDRNGIVPTVLFCPREGGISVGGGVGLCARGHSNDHTEYKTHRCRQGLVDKRELEHVLVRAERACAPPR